MFYCVYKVLSKQKGSGVNFSRVAVKGLQNYAYGEFSQSGGVWMKLYVNTEISPLYYCIDEVFLATEKYSHVNVI